ncbi:uncharacterized protein LOC125228915 [Leguminivora glycinivorella]|uniref:uncharacterized protein LOC125228915 n=1 Tax=Leguminivora glycinivorella TaxID=1035111 RepID=UPI00200BD1D7|nr:uncharacterized protein LOC125228915 [Leguminivora glycinivorella]
MFSFKVFFYLCFITPVVLGYRRIKHSGTDLILAKAGETIEVVCDKDVPLVRCGFTHPNGTKVLFVDVVPGTPSCKFTTDVTPSEIGLWTCHLWTPMEPQEEITKTVEVRVVDKFSALDREVGVRKGDRATLSCVSSEGMVPLNGCFFTSPRQERIHMDDGIIEENLVLNKYFYPPNLSVHRGDCSITIQSTDVTDEGIWACTGLLEFENRAYTDYIRLSLYDVTEATDLDVKPFIITAATFACVTLCLIAFLALICWKERYYTRFYGRKWDEDSLESFGMKTDVSQRIRETK